MAPVLNRVDRPAVTRLATVLAAVAGYVVAVVWPWHHRPPDADLVDQSAAAYVTGLVTVFLLPVVAYLAAVPSIRSIAGGTGRRRLVLHAAVIALALVAIALYVSPWGIAATRGFLAD